MLESLKDLFVLIVIAIPILWMVQNSFGKLLLEDQIKRYRNAWIAITLILFLSHNYWLYVLLTIVTVQFAQQREQNKTALYIVLLFSMPPVLNKVGAFGMVEFLFELNPWRILELAILFPACLAIMRQGDSLSFGKTTPDKLLAGYILAIFLFRFRETTMTDALREGLYAFTDIFLPYFVISRSLREIKQFKEVLAAFVIAGLLLASAAIYEYAIHHLLYAELGNVLKATLAMTGMVIREGSLRALVTTGQPIALGYVLMVALGFYLFLQRDIVNGFVRKTFLVLLAGGLFASLSRGPWVGMAILYVVYVLLGPNLKRNMIFIFTGIGALSIATAMKLPGTEKLLALLPFIGTTDQFNVDYRKNLFDSALIVIQRNPFFGSAEYIHTPEMQSMVQGEGIVDIVNSYLGIALEYGLISLALFAGFFLTILWGIFGVLRQYRSSRVQHFIFGVMVFPAKQNSLEDERYLLGVTLFAVLVGILVTIYSVSSITVIPVVYWAVAGLGAAYIRMHNQFKNMQS
jgi:O-antigen ligase